MVNRALSSILLMTLGFGCQAPPPAASSEKPPEAAASPAAPAESPVEHLKVKILATHPHDPQAYTQGLVWHDGKLFESAGNYGTSNLREVNPETGKVLRSVPVAPQYFAEGLALVDDRLIQLTWKESTAFVYGLATFDPQPSFSYTGEGWGLCSDGQRLVMSDGSDRLTFRDPKTFTPTGGVNVSENGQPVLNLNELECVDGAVYANVWQEDRIVRIDPATGHVTADIAAAGLLTPEESAEAEVLNGIAWRPDTKRFYITGKNWPKLFEVVFEK